ncbi:MAG: SAM-dependent methyltransferase [Betaproteobacteria bacterium]|nr:SAM-dependent methyltransferase [Betaproteobacteria bacterium]
MNHGTLYLIPVPLGPGDPATVLPAPVLANVRTLGHFIAENAKSARAFLKACGTERPLQQISIAELNEHTRPGDLPALLAPLLAGSDVGLVSEAGSPAVADPGATLVALAHQHAIRVVPLVGPSSLLLALMASGLDGQRFAFHGYLPARDTERAQALRTIENESRKLRQTQIFIETPYRNRALFETLLKTCQPTTRLALATDLTLPGESVRTLPVAAWKKATPPDLERRPTVFLLLA